MMDAKSFSPSKHKSNNKSVPRSPSTPRRSLRRATTTSTSSDSRRGNPILQQTSNGVDSCQGPRSKRKKTIPNNNSCRPMPLRASNRLKASRYNSSRRRTNLLSHMYYKPNLRRKSNTNNKDRVTATRIAKMLQPGRHSLRRSSQSNARSGLTDNMNNQMNSDNLRRSTRKRKVAFNLEDYETDHTDTEDADLMPAYRNTASKRANTHSQDEHSSPVQRKKNRVTAMPRREGLRPRRSTRMSLHQSQESEDEEQESSDADREEGDAGDEAEEDGEDDVEEEEEEEEEDEEEEGEEQDGRKRYALRARTEVRRFSPEKEEKQRPRSPPRRVLQQGILNKNSRESRRGRMHKRHRPPLVDDSDDSLLVDEHDQGAMGSITRNGNRNFAPPWACAGPDVHGTTLYNLSVAASGWGHQGDLPGINGISSQTTGQGYKGGADIQPLQVNEDVSFEDIGGLSDYIMALKEMVFFPLLYPDFFANYHISPPRGVLLCGPPGTGKTLVARALACSASKAGQKVSFYMRKGADVLSKWVGEAERQLKLLFEEAQKNQPSIIFFDEIDGLAPVRSSKQEQIHNSIVSTLLALMDGLDSRGQVVLIGATNRVDAIDSALRRPGRFDREFVFPLPDCKARSEILNIHTRKWKDPLPEGLLDDLAAACVGYCGADLKALCTETAIMAFREKYPQVYTSDDQFVIDVSSVKVEKRHFLNAMAAITPAAHRATAVSSSPLSPVIAPCLKSHFEKITEKIAMIFPVAITDKAKDSSSQNNFQTLVRLSGSSCSSLITCIYRPRFLICGNDGDGLGHVAPAILHELEKFPVHSIGFSSLLSDPSAKSPEEALVHIMSEARRTAPSILYLPQLNAWWETAHEQLKGTFLTMLAEFPSTLPVLLLGTSSAAFENLEEKAARVFDRRYIYTLRKPGPEDRLIFFAQLVDTLLAIPEEKSDQSAAPNVSLPQLPKVPKSVSGPSEKELQAKAEAEGHAIRRLRMCLRDICNKLLADKRFRMFHVPVDVVEFSDYPSIIQNPMDLSTLLRHVDNGKYLTKTAFLEDVDLIPANARAYNGDDYGTSNIVSKALALKDSVCGMLSQIDPALISYCDSIAAQGGPTRLPDSKQNIPSQPVVQQVHNTRASARLRNVQPELNASQSYEFLKRSKRNNDADQGDTDAVGSSGQLNEENPESMQIDTDVENLTQATNSSQHDSDNKAIKESDHMDSQVLSEKEMHDNVTIENISSEVFQTAESTTSPKSPTNKQLTLQTEIVKQDFVKATEGYGVGKLEELYSMICQGVNMLNGAKDKAAIIKYLKDFVSEESHFS